MSILLRSSSSGCGGSDDNDDAIDSICGIRASNGAAMDVLLILPTAGNASTSLYSSSGGVTGQISSTGDVQAKTFDEDSGGCYGRDVSEGNTFTNVVEVGGEQRCETCAKPKRLSGRDSASVSLSSMGEAVVSSSDFIVQFTTAGISAPSPLKSSKKAASMVKSKFMNFKRSNTTGSADTEGEGSSSGGGGSLGNSFTGGGGFRSPSLKGASPRKLVKSIRRNKSDGCTDGGDSDEDVGGHGIGGASGTIPTVATAPSELTDSSTGATTTEAVAGNRGRLPSRISRDVSYRIREGNEEDGEEGQDSSKWSQGPTGGEGEDDESGVPPPPPPPPTGSTPTLTPSGSGGSKTCVTVVINGQEVPGLEMEIRSNGMCRFIDGQSLKPRTTVLHRLVQEGVVQTGRNVIRYVAHYPAKGRSRSGNSSASLFAGSFTSSEAINLSASISSSFHESGAIGSGGSNNNLLESTSNLSVGSPAVGGSGGSGDDLRTATSPLQKRYLEASLYVWNAHDSVVVSDIDGTITKSDMVGVIDTVITESYSEGATHRGVCKLFHDIAKAYEEWVEKHRMLNKSGSSTSSLLSSPPDQAPASSGSLAPESGVVRRRKGGTNDGSGEEDGLGGAESTGGPTTSEVDDGKPVVLVAETTDGTVEPPPSTCRFMYLTSRPISLLDTTRRFLKALRQGSLGLPPGPVFCNGGNLMDVLFMELAKKNTHEFKADVLARQVVLPFAAAGRSSNQKLIFAAFGNKGTDAMAYQMAGAHVRDIYVINKKSEILCLSDPNTKNKLLGGMISKANKLGASMTAAALESFQNGIESATSDVDEALGAVCSCGSDADLSNNVPLQSVDHGEGFGTGTRGLERLGGSYGANDGPGETTAGDGGGDVELRSRDATPLLHKVKDRQSALLRRHSFVSYDDPHLFESMRVKLLESFGKMTQHHSASQTSSTKEIL